MPKTPRVILGALTLMAGVLFAAAPPAAADMTSRGCDWAVSGWSNVKVCITITYHQPTASQYEIDKIKVEATDVGDTKRVEFSAIAWDGDTSPWDRNGTLNADNNWDKVYTPDSLRITIAGGNDGVSCFGTAYFDAGGSSFFSTGGEM